jgi:Ca-activated chloride channel family protein
VLTDGANTAGRLSPQQAAWVAAQRGVRIHVLGVGAGADAAILQAIAGQAGGAFAQATAADAIRDFYAHVDRLEPAVRAPASHRQPVLELYLLPLLAGAVTLAAAELLFPRTRKAHRRGGP